MAKKVTAVTDKNDPFALAIAACQKQYGADSIMTFNDASLRDVEFVSAGSLLLDKALGGGYPKGRVIEIFGPESSGKTTVCLHAVAEVQKAGGRAVYIDAEHALDPAYTKALGVDIQNLAISQPDCAEQVFDIAEKMIPHADIVVIDSVAAMVPKAERDGEMSDNNIGLHARIMSKGLRKITPLASQSGCIVIFVNQIRMKIGVMFGSPETTTGGNALKFYASQRLDVRRTTTPNKEGKGDDAIAVSNSTKVKVIKNKVAPPFRIAEFDIRYGVGIDKVKETLDLAVKTDIIVKGGAWYTYGDTKIQSEAKVWAWLNENPEIREEIAEKIRNFEGEIVEEPDIISQLMGIPEEPSVEYSTTTNEIISDDPLDHIL